MNYYERHIGDFIRDTVSLSMLEDGAYNRLIDQCYQTERPLPGTKVMVYRLARANTPAEKKAVDFVLESFFVLVADGYRQKRIDAEIERFHEGDVDRDAKRENAKERQRRTREHRKEIFETLRSHGIFPEWNAPVHELQAHLSRVTGAKQSPPVTTPVTRDATANQTPDTSNHSKALRPSSSAVPAAPDPEHDPPLPTTTSKSVTDRALDLVLLLKPRGCRIPAGNPYVLDWARRGVTDAQLLTALERAESARHDKGDPQPVNAGYLNAIVDQVATATPTIDYEALARL